MDQLGRAGVTMGDRIAAERDLYAAPAAGDGRVAVVSSFALPVTTIIILVYAAAAVLLIPAAKVPGPYVPGVIPLFVAGIVVTKGATSYLLITLFRDARSWSILLLGCAYFYAALMGLAQLATFPGAMLPERPLLPVSDQTAAWIFAAWNVGFASLVLAAVSCEARPQYRAVRFEKPKAVIVFGLVAIAMAAAIALSAAAHLGGELPLVSGGRFTPAAGVLRFIAVTLLCSSVAVILLVMRAPSTLYLWLSVALTAVLFHNVMAGAGGGPFSVGWLVGRLSWLVSACALFLYFLRQFPRQQRVLTRAQGLLGHFSETAPTYPGETRKAFGEAETRLSAFVAAENVRRYKAMLDSQPGEVHRQVITTLLAEEETRLHQASAGPVP
jgi:hypothetical protein